MTQYSILQISYGTSTKILSKDIDRYTYMCGLNIYETDVTYTKALK